MKKTVEKHLLSSEILQMSSPPTQTPYLVFYRSQVSSYQLTDHQDWSKNKSYLEQKQYN